MPRSGNGIGTVYYGRSSEAEDGSYVTTVWAVFLFLPLFPLRSERVLPVSEFSNGAGAGWTRFTIVGRVPLDWREIRKSYVVGWGILSWYVSLLFLYEVLARIFGSGNGPWIVLGWFFLPFGVWGIWETWCLHFLIRSYGRY